MEIIRGMPEAEYRARPEISQSDYKKFLLPTLAHTKWELEKEKTQTESMTLGTCLHSLVLENTTIYAVMPKVDLRTTIGKATKAEFEAANEGKIILTSEQAAKIEGMARGIEKCPAAMALLRSATEREVSIFDDGEKARLDLVTPIGPCDLKTTSDGSNHGFSTSIETFGYHIQSAMYLDFAARAGFCDDDFRFIVVENVAPFVAGVVKIPHQSIEFGRLELERLRARRLHAMRDDRWPGYAEREIGLPFWKIKEFEREYGE